MKSNRFLAVLTAVLLLVGVSAFAQTTSNLTGTVTLGGNPLPGATVTISSPNLQGVRTTVTDQNGNYNYGGLPPGDYTVKFDMESMQSVTKTVRVGLAQTARADAELRLTAVAEAITVTASSPAVLETTEVQTNITSKLVEDLPMGRTLLATANLAPGVSSNGPNGATTISGAPSFDNLFLVDGAVVNENLRGQPHDLFIEDAIQETTVLSGAVSAEFGRFTGGVVTAVSKSGGNEFSGSFRDSLTNPKWTSRTPFEIEKNQTPIDKINSVYEATLGGRIIRDRLWFFAAGRHFKTTTQNSFRPNLTADPTGLNYNYTQGRKQDREELKLTGQITPKHSLTLSGLNIEDKQTNNNFGNLFEPSAIDVSRELPNSFLTAHYNGVVTNNFLIEANASRKRYAFVGSGGDAIGDVVRGTNVYNAARGWYMGAPTFCGACGNESRNNRNWNVKGTYYLSTKSFGSHNIVGGYDDWQARRTSDNHQSASDFTIYDYYNRTDYPKHDANGNALVTWNPAVRPTLIIWWPILESSKGTDLTTKSVFVNDKWDFNNRLSFNVGARYDKNQGADSAGNKVANDNKISPRLGVTYDVAGNGRIRVNASYSEYVSAIADGNIADAASPAGSPSILYWLYRGPAIVGQPTQTALTTLFNWFNSVGGTHNTSFLLGGGSNGIATQIPTPLKSPYVGEWTVGAGTQIGARGYIRGDLIHRDWKNFYSSITNQQTGQAPDPLVGGALVDVGILQNTDNLTRKYDALQFQASYQPWTRINVGGNYTYSKLKGNAEQETSGSGPVSNTNPASYPEYLSYANFNPTGYLSADQRHKARAWVTYDQPTPVGMFNISVLQSFDSGTPFSYVGTIDPSATATKDYGYIFPPTSANYYFSKRGQFRNDNISSTSLALNYNAPPIGKVQLYVEGELRNAFNRHGQIGGTTTVTVLNDFDPFNHTPTQCPTFAANGTANTANTCAAAGTYDYLIPSTTASHAATSAASYQAARTYLVSAGVRF